MIFEFVLPKCIGQPITPAGSKDPLPSGMCSVKYGQKETEAQRDGTDLLCAHMEESLYLSVDIVCSNAFCLLYVHEENRFSLH